MADAAQLASLADETPEGRSIVVLAKERFDIRERQLDGDHTFIPFSATTRMSGLDVDGRQIRKGAAESVKQWVDRAGRDRSRRSRPHRRADLPRGVDAAGRGRRPRRSSASSS